MQVPPAVLRIPPFGLPLPNCRTPTAGLSLQDPHCSTSPARLQNSSCRTPPAGLSLKLAQSDLKKEPKRNSKRYSMLIGLEPTWPLYSLRSFLNVFIGLSRTHGSFHLDPSDWEANVSVMLWSRCFPAKFRWHIQKRLSSTIIVKGVHTYNAERLVTLFPRLKLTRGRRGRFYC